MREPNAGRLLGWMLLPFALILAVPGASWAVGRSLESRLQEYRQPLLDAAPWLRISSRSFERGVFSSHEELEIEVSLGAQARHFTIVSDVQHGPFPGLAWPALARMRSTLRLQGSADTAARELFGGQSPVTVLTRFSLLGGGHSEVLVPQLDAHIGPDGAHVIWQGFKGELDFTRHSDRIAVQASAPLLRVESAKNGKLELVGLALNSEAKRVFEELYAGGFEVKLNSMKVAGPTGVALSATGVSYGAEIPVGGENSEFVDVFVRVGADKARISGQEYGPAHYDVSVRHLHGPTLALLTRELRRVSDKLRVTGDLAALKAFDDASLQSAFRQLLLAKPSLSIDRISATSPQGPFSVKGEAHFSNLQSSDFSAASLTSLLPKLEAQADFSVPAAWASLAGARVLPRGDPDANEVPAAAEPATEPSGGASELDELVRRGFVKRSGDLIISHVEFRQGKLLLNGRSFGE